MYRRITKITRPKLRRAPALHHKWQVKSTRSGSNPRASALSRLGFSETTRRAHAVPKTFVRLRPMVGFKAMPCLLSSAPPTTLVSLAVLHPYVAVKPLARIGFLEQRSQSFSDGRGLEASRSDTVCLEPCAPPNGRFHGQRNEERAKVPLSSRWEDNSKERRVVYKP